MAGLSETGFEIIRLPEIIEQHNEDAQSIFEDLVEVGDTVDFSPDSTLGRLIGLISPSEAIIWEQLQAVWDAFNPDAAYGIALDNIVAFSGITRRRATSSRAYLLITGGIGGSVLAGTEVVNNLGDVIYKTDAALVINTTAATQVGISVFDPQVAETYGMTITSISGGTYSYSTVPGSFNDATPGWILQDLQAKINADSGVSGVQATYTGGILTIFNTDLLNTCRFVFSSNLRPQWAQNVVITSDLTPGPQTVEANTLVRLAIANPAVLQVSNPYASSGGANEENDEELRQRFEVSKYLRAGNMLESLYAALLALPGVSQAVIYENDTDVADANNVPPHSFLTVVNGGFADDIAKAIWLNRPTGVKSVGDISVPVIDQYGGAQVSRFRRPDNVEVYITMDIEEGADFPADGRERIIANLQSFFANMRMGDTVYFSRLYTPINNVPGHYLNNLQIGLSPSQLASENLTIPYLGVARLLAQNVVFL